MPAKSTIGAAMNTEDAAEITIPATMTQAKPDKVSPPKSASGNADKSRVMEVPMERFIVSLMERSTSSRIGIVL